MNIPDRLVGIPVAEDRLGLSRVTIWRKGRNDPNFPQPIRVGGRTLFSEISLNSWIAAQVEAAQSQAA
jgi:predicted DNA-binding transcriptional regulator AlpA